MTGHKRDRDCEPERDQKWAWRRGPESGTIGGSEIITKSGETQKARSGATITAFRESAAGAKVGQALAWLDTGQRISMTSGGTQTA